MNFTDLDLDQRIQESISYMGFESLTPIQEMAIPKILANNDLIACAQTGTGKTAAYVLPILHKMAEEEKRGINTLIIVPTRELAKQIEQQIQGFSYFLGISSIAIYGGGDGIGFDQEKSALSGDTDFVVATPGKLISHLNMGYVNLATLEHLVLDEADKMLDMGFYEDILKIAGFLPKKRQTLMFSATMPPKIRSLAKSILTNPSEISIELSKPAEGVLQAVYLVYEEQKIPLVNSLLAGKDYVNSVLIFTSTKSKVSGIVRGLRNNGYGVEGMSSDLEQTEREEVLGRFRARKTRVLVATDLLSRGIDIKEIQLIINFDVPHDAEDYVHRVGRTARASATGVAITLVSPPDMFRLGRIESLIERTIPRIPLPGEFGEAPEWNPGRVSFRKPGQHPRKGKERYPRRNHSSGRK
jgi:superfamily II DNA/RNA helicase